MTQEPQQTKPIKPYTSVKSQFIKNKIKEKNFDKVEDREYIHTLIEFEEYILGNFNPGYPYGMFFSSKKTELEKEYESIYKELKPNKWKEKQKKKQKKKRERKKEKKKRVQKKKEELHNSREQWRNVKS